MSGNKYENGRQTKPNLFNRLTIVLTSSALIEPEQNRETR